MKNIILTLFLTITTISASINIINPAETKHPEETRSPKVAYELFKVLNMSETYQETLEKIVNLQITQNPAMAPAKDALFEFFRKHMGWKNMKEDMSKIYMKHYTDEEMKKLMVFYRTPIGKKSAMLVPALTAAGTKLGHQKVQKNMAELKALIENALKDARKKKNLQD